MFLSLNVNVIPGTDIEIAVRDAEQLSAKLSGMLICFSFNGVWCGVRQGDDLDLLVKDVMDRLNSDE